MKQESKNNGWLSCRDSLAGFYNRVELAKAFTGCTEIVQVLSGEWVLTEFGEWVNHNTNERLNLFQVHYWRPSFNKVRRWIGRSRLTGHSKEFMTRDRATAWELADKWRRDNFMVLSELELLEVTGNA